MRQRSFYESDMNTKPRAYCLEIDIRTVWTLIGDSAALRLYQDPIYK